MEIKSISASRIKTYDTCKYKYVITYMLYQCDSCDETFYTNEIKVEKHCPYCEAPKIHKIRMKSNWGAVHGTACHQICEDYANAIRGYTEDGTKLSKADIKKMLDWKAALAAAYKRGTNNGQKNPKFSILDLAKPKDVADEKKWCKACASGKKGAVCAVSGETLATMKKHGCQGCPQDLYSGRQGSIALLERYIGRYDPILQNRKILGVEAAFSLDFGALDCHGNPMMATGYMDLVTELDEDTVELVDHKFGQFVPDFEEFSEDIQVKIYALACRQLYPQYKEYIMTFDYARKGPISIAFDADDDEKTKQWVIKKWNEIADPQKVSRCVRDPDTFWKCKYMCDNNLCKVEWEKFKEKFNYG